MRKNSMAILVKPSARYLVKMDSGGRYLYTPECEESRAGGRLIEIELERRAKERLRSCWESTHGPFYLGQSDSRSQEKINDILDGAVFR